MGGRDARQRRSFFDEGGCVLGVHCFGDVGEVVEKVGVHARQRSLGEVRRGRWDRRGVGRR